MQAEIDSKFTSDNIIYSILGPFNSHALMPLTLFDEIFFQTPILRQISHPQRWLQVLMPLHYFIVSKPYLAKWNLPLSRIPSTIHLEHVMSHLPKEKEDFFQPFNEFRAIVDPENNLKINVIKDNFLAMMEVIIVDPQVTFKPLNLHFLMCYNNFYIM